MYNHNVTPMAMGIGGSGSLALYSMSWFWVVLATFAIAAMFSAIRRSVPKAMIVVLNNDVDPDPVTAPIEIQGHARL